MRAQRWCGADGPVRSLARLHREEAVLHEALLLALHLREAPAVLLELLVHLGEKHQSKEQSKHLDFGVVYIRAW